MRNQQLADIFTEMADIMEILGEDSFRISSYRKVARVIQDCRQDVAVLAAEGRLEELPGVGKASAQKINEFVHSGLIRWHRELRSKIPPGLLDMLKIPGMGPKSAAAVWQGLKVTTLAGLKEAIENHRLEELPGFGAKKAELLGKGLAFLASAGGRVLLAHGLVLAEQVLAELRDVKGVERVEMAGSLRRGCETIGDIDLLAQAEDGEVLLAAFTHLPGVQQVLAAGETKAAIRYAQPELCPEAAQVDLRVVPAKSFGAAWQYFTGSKYHNVRLRGLAGRKKLKLNEYGLFLGDKPLAGAREEDVYAKLGLAWVPPPLREDRGEVEAAGAGGGGLPALVEEGDIKGDLHVHSPASDGHNTIEELIAAARRRGYKYLAITDHSPSSVIANGLNVQRLRENSKKIRKVNESLKGFTVLAGAEVDVLLDGRLDYPDEVLAELDFVIASVHSGLKGSRERNTARLLRALENPYVNCLGHPTGRMIQVREAMELDLEAVIAQAARTGTALEVSASPLRLDLSDVHCRRAAAAGAKLLINTDAHDAESLDQMRFGVLTAQRGWARRADVLNCQGVAVLRRWVQTKRRRARP